MKWGSAIGGGAFAALVSLAVASSALAADLSVGPRPVQSYIPAQFLWTGFYLGTGIGGGWGSTSFTDPLPGTNVEGGPSIDGILVGGVTGINYQIGAVVLGTEGDFTGSWAKGNAVDTAGNNLQTSVFWTASITGRAGFALDRTLIYAKGGVGFAYDRDVITVPGQGLAQGSVYRDGWTVGGGVEYALTEHWTGRIEYDFFKFPVKGMSLSGPASPTGSANTNVGINFNEIMAIIAYKF